MSTPSSKKPAAASPPPTRASTAPDAPEAFSRTEPTPTATRTTTAAAAAAAAVPLLPTSARTDSQFKVYKPPASATPQAKELPDDYFTPTIADLQARQHHLHARAVALNNAPLVTRAQREEQAKTKRDRWPNSTIRVRFPDRTQLEKVFPSSSKIRTIYSFVRDALREDVKPIKFILASNPPPRDLKVSDPAVRDLTLAELGLAPSSILHLRFVDDGLNRSDLPAPLASAILEHAVDLPAPPGFDGNQKKEEAPPTVSASSSNRTRDTAGGHVKVPKWLKLGSKK